MLTQEATTARDENERVLGPTTLTCRGRDCGGNWIILTEINRHHLTKLGRATWLERRVDGWNQVEGRGAIDFTHGLRDTEWDCSNVCELIRVSGVLKATVESRNIRAALDAFADIARKRNLRKKM
jgi:hypothetical protein